LPGAALDPPTARRNGPFDLAAVENSSDPVAVPGQQARQGNYKIDQHVSLLYLLAAKIDGWAEIEQEPGCDLAVLHVLADMWCVERAVTFQSI
jgi:hypothetical protein